MLQLLAKITLAALLIITAIPVGIAWSMALANFTEQSMGSKLMLCAAPVIYLVLFCGIIMW